MILHARTTTNVADDEDLDVLIFRILSWTIAGWDEIGEPAQEPYQEDTAEAASDDGNNESG
jgi:hypothetical protein